MNELLHLHILGASGSGTTTLGRMLAAQFASAHLDTDDFYWEQTDPPYQTPRPPEQRHGLLQQTLKRQPRWVISGSLCGWGDPLIPQFDAVIFVTLPAEIRLERTRQREQARFGAELQEGGQLHQKHLDFMAWSAIYDDPAARNTNAGLPDSPAPSSACRTWERQSKRC